jgi:hypothetical protein
MAVAYFRFQLFRSFSLRNEGKHEKLNSDKWALLPRSGPYASRIQGRLTKFLRLGYQTENNVPEKHNFSMPRARDSMFL